MNEHHVEEREKPIWKRVRSYTSGDIRCELSSTEGKKGPLYSFSVYKVKRDGSPTKFFHPLDLEDVIVVVEDLEDYLKEIGVALSNA